MLDVFKLRAALLAHYGFKENKSDDVSLLKKKERIVRLVDEYAKSTRRHQLTFVELQKFITADFENSNESIALNYIYKILKQNWKIIEYEGHNAIDWRQRKNKIIGYIK